MLNEKELNAILQRMDKDDIPVLVDEIEKIKSIGWIGKTIAYMAFISLITLMLSLAFGIVSVVFKSWSS